MSRGVVTLAGFPVAWASPNGLTSFVPISPSAWRLALTERVLEQLHQPVRGVVVAGDDHRAEVGPLTSFRVSEPLDVCRYASTSRASLPTLAAGND